MQKRNRGRNQGTTEDVPTADQYVDRLPVGDALGLMLDRQENAITAVRNALPAIAAAALAAHDRLAKTDHGRLIYAGAGTSARIGVQDGVELTPTFNWPRARLGFLVAGGDAALMGAIENAEDDAAAGGEAASGLDIGPDDVVIGLAASGRTPFTLGVLKAAKAAGAVTIGVANNPQTPLLGGADFPVFLETGGEIIAGSTRLTAGTSQKICLNLISNIIMVRMGFVIDGMMAAMVPTNEKLRQRRKRIDALLNRG
jgi:N-acetylmuramic acid 6-phosphate etherase